MFLPTDHETVAALMREEAVNRENDALWLFFHTTLEFLAALETVDRPYAIAVHRALRDQAAAIKTGEAWEVER
jgi:hypothetical protein